MTTDYPIPIEWSDREWAEIEKARKNAMARRILGLSNKGHSVRQFCRNPDNEERLRAIVRDVWKSER